MNLSIIIAALQEAESLEKTLLSVLENRPDDAEVIVVHNGFYEDPYGLCGEVEFIAEPDLSSTIDCMNLGASHAMGEILHTLNAGVIVSASWTELALSHFQSKQIAAVVPKLITAPQSITPQEEQLAWQLQQDAAGYPVFDKASHKSDAATCWHGAGFYQSDFFNLLGGFHARLGNLFADLDLSAIFRRLDLEIVAANDCSVIIDQPLDHIIANVAAVQKVCSLQERHAEEFQTAGLYKRWAAILGHTIKGLPSPNAMQFLLSEAFNLNSKSKRVDEMDWQSLQAKVESYLERAETLPLVQFRKESAGAAQHSEAA